MKRSLLVLAALLFFSARSAPAQDYSQYLKEAGEAPFILISKADFTLTLVGSDGRAIRSYGCAVARNFGPKQKKGDHKTPEGTFKINQLLDSHTLTHDFGAGKGPIKGAYGPWFLRLDVPGFIDIGIHGTHLPASIGSRATEGCIRLRNEDILDLKARVKVGTPVIILPEGEPALPQAELWIFSGQSNMELPVSRCMDVVAADVRDFSCPDIHYMKVPLTWNFDSVQDTLPAGCFWQTLDSPRTALDWGALCYFTARYLHEATSHPVYAINSSVGGSPIEAWMPEAALPQSAMGELQECRDPEWMERTLYHNAHLYSDWQNAHNGLPENKKAQWEDIEMFGDWGLEDGREVYGSHYLRNTFRLDAAQASSDALLRLGAMRDADSTFVNGHFVGNTTYMYPPRNYNVPAAFLQEGENVVDIHLYAADNAAGFVPDKEYCLETAAGTVQLSSLWRHKAGRRMPRRPGQVFLQYRPTGLYNAMLAPLAKEVEAWPAGSLKGVVWYQGESNVSRADEYAYCLKAMIEDWRNLFGREDLPFYIVELASYQHSERQSAQTSGWVRLQDVQREVAGEMENVFLVPNRDLGEWNDIHPQDKKTLGRRTADLILETAKH